MTALNDTYATRKSVLEPETIWRLTPDALVRDRAGPAPGGLAKTANILYRVMFPWASRLVGDAWPDRVPYGEITSMRFRFDPTRFDLSRERLDLTNDKGDRISLFSTRYVSPAHFIDQAPAYRPFINELTQRVLTVRPQTPVYWGLSWRSYLLQHGFLLLTLLALSTIVARAGVSAIDTVWAKIFITLGYIGAVWPYAKRNLPRKLNGPPG